MQTNLENVFDDIVMDDVGTWTQLCSSCMLKFEYLGTVDKVKMYAICGVKGCWTEADYYLDFKTGLNSNAK